MRHTLKILLVGASLMMPTLASAACQLEASGTVSVAGRFPQGTEQLPASAVATQYASLLAGDSTYTNAGCDSETILRELLTVNNWQGDRLLSRSDSIRLVRLVTPVAPPPSALVMVSNPVVQPLRATPEVTAARRELASTRRSLARAQARVAGYNTISARRQGRPGAMLTPAEKAEYDAAVTAVASLQAKVVEIESQLAGLQTRMTANEAVDAGQARDITRLTNRMKTLENAPAGQGFPLWGWALIALSLLVGIIAFFRRLPRVDTSNFATKQELAVVNAKAEAANSRFKHKVEPTPSTLKPLDLKNLNDGDVFDYPLMVDGQEVTFKGTVVQHTPSGGAVVKLDELNKPIGASRLYATLCDYIERDGTLPTLKVVNG